MWMESDRKLEFNIEPEHTSEQGGESIYIYLLTPKVDRWGPYRDTGTRGSKNFTGTRGHYVSVYGLPA
jgi:hypothetical protein